MLCYANLKYIFPTYVFSFILILIIIFQQNDRITKLKIDNNPFAKGFRETGQSRCKRKLTQSNSTITLSSSPLLPAIPPTIINPNIKGNSTTFVDLTTKRRRNSFNGSIDSIDEQSISGRSSGTSSPPSTDSYEDIRVIGDEEQVRIVQHQEVVMQQLRDRIPHPSWMGLAFSYLTQTRSSCPSFYPQNTHHDFMGMSSGTATMSSFLHTQTINNEMNQQLTKVGVSAPSPTSMQNLSVKPRKKCGFSISAILGCER